MKKIILLSVILATVGCEKAYQERSPEQSNSVLSSSGLEKVEASESKEVELVSETEVEAKEVKPVSVNQSCSADSFPARLTVKGDDGATCGITLSGATGGGNSLPDNNGRGFSYWAQGSLEDKVPGTGRVCLVCRDNKVQVSENPDTDCQWYTNNKPQFCQPKTCEIPANYGWGRCQSSNAKRTLAWGESMTLQNTSTRAKSGSVTLTCAGEQGLQGKAQESEAGCDALSHYTEVESFSLEKVYLGKSQYMSYIGYGNYATIKVCSPYTSLPYNPDCKTIKFDSSILDKSYSDGSFSKAFTVNQGKEVSFWVNGLMVMVMNPWAFVSPGNPESIIVPANVQPHSSTTVRQMSITVTTNAKDPITIYEAFPRLYFSKRAIEKLKYQNVDLSGLEGKELTYDRSFEFKPADVPWN